MPLKSEKKLKISASILAADFASLEREIRKIEKTNTHFLHLDVIDGVFAPNITFGIPVIKRIADLTDIPLDLHLMISNPQNYLEQFAKYNMHNITIHLEAVNHVNRVLNSIRQMKCKVGIALNPSTHILNIEYLLEYLDQVLIMSVNPGFSGQKFIPNSIEKIRKCREMIDKSNNDIEIAVDGGVGIDNVEQIKNAGADIIVAGNAIFKTKDYHKAVLQLLNDR